MVIRRHPPLVFGVCALAGLALVLGLPAAASAATPSVTTLSITSTGAANATVHGTVNPEGKTTAYQVQWDGVSSDWCMSGGSSGSPASTTTATDLGFTDNTAHDVSVDLTGLSFAAEYCARLIAKNHDGEGDGDQMTWTQAQPQVDTFDTISTGLHTATVRGDFNPVGLETSYWVQYGLASSDWCTSGGTSGSPANTTTATEPNSTNPTYQYVSIDLSGLTEGAEYCAQLIATNPTGVAEGGQVAWTQGAPSADTLDALATGISAATVEGQVNPAGKTTTYRLKYDLASSEWCTSGGSSGSPADITDATAVPFVDGSFHDVSAGLTGLTPSASYCAELTATNVDGTSAGGLVTWTQPSPPPRFTLTVHVFGPGGVTSSPSGIDCTSTCSSAFDAGTQVTLTATGGSFSGWGTFGLGCPTAGSGVRTCTFTLTSDKTVSAFFTALPSASLSVQRAGTGSGTITSSPAGIDCGATCNSWFTVGSTLTLTATASPGSVFTGWSRGGCSGTGTCSVTMLASGNPIITATFDQAPPPPPPVAPHCTLKATGSKVKLKGSKAGLLPLKVTCDQGVTVSVTGKVTIKVKKGRKTRTSHVSLRPAHASVEAGSTLRVVMKLPKAALSKLRKHAAESVAFKLTAKNADGSTTARASIRHLRGY